MEYKCGDVYEGQFNKDRKHGMGTQYYANGDCFVGFFINDRREGLGTMYWLSRAKKYEGEWQEDRCAPTLYYLWPQGSPGTPASPAGETQPTTRKGRVIFFYLYIYMLYTIQEV